jgi:type II secretory pathway pseudopilin PulG
MKKAFVKGNKGFSIIEVLVAAGVFAILGILSTSAILISLKGSKKSESQLKVRDNLNYVLGIMERQIRNAKSISCAGNTLNYVDADGKSGAFALDGVSRVTWKRPGEATAFGLTSTDVKVESCTFVCSGTGIVPPNVDIKLMGKDPDAASDDEGAQVIVSTKVQLRTY